MDDDSVMIRVDIDYHEKTGINFVLRHRNNLKYMKLIDTIK